MAENKAVQFNALAADENYLPDDEESTAEAGEGLASSHEQVSDSYRMGTVDDILEDRNRG